MKKDFENCFIIPKTYSVTVVTSVPWDMGMRTASRDAVWEKLFFPLQLKLISITQFNNCTFIGSSRIKKLTNPRRWRASQWLFSPI